MGSVVCHSSLEGNIPLNPGTYFPLTSQFWPVDLSIGLGARVDSYLLMQKTSGVAADATVDFVRQMAGKRYAVELG